MTTLLAILRVSAFFGVSVFIVTYWVRAPWERSEVGWNIMTLAAGSWLLLGLSVLRQLVTVPVPYHPAYWGEPVLLLVGYLAVNVAFWWRWVMLLRAQEDTSPRAPGT